MKKEKTYNRAVISGFIFCLGIAMLFFKETKEIGPFLIGFGLVVCLGSLGGD